MYGMEDTAQSSIDHSKIILSDPTYGGDFGDLSDVMRDLRSEFQRSNFEAELTNSDIGRGADWPVVIAALTGLAMLGKKIDEGIEGWIKVARRIRKLVNKLKRKKKLVAIDRHIANLLCLEYIGRHSENVPRKIELAGESIIALQTVEHHQHGGVERYPDAIYVMKYLVDSSTLHVFLVGTEGTIKSRLTYQIDLLSGLRAAQLPDS